MGKKVHTKGMRATARDWLKVMILLLDEVAVLVILFLALRYFGVELPLPVTVILALLAGVLIFMVHKAVIPSFHRQQVTGREGMIGMQCKVVEALTPLGVVTVVGEHWKAKAADEDIEVDEDVEIVAIDRLMLSVRRKE